MSITEGIQHQAPSNWGDDCTISSDGAEVGRNGPIDTTVLCNFSKYLIFIEQF